MQRFEGEAPVVRLRLPWEVKVELSRFIALAPLAQVDFRVPIDGVVTCSDASTQGGGACSSTGPSGGLRCPPHRGGNQTVPQCPGAC